MKAVCTAVNVIGNVDMDATTGEVKSLSDPQVIVQLVTVTDGKRTDVTISNPTPDMHFEVNKTYDLSYTEVANG